MSTSKPRVAVGLSGGVDSSVAAYLLQQQGYDVIGLTFRNWPQDCLSRAEDKCCGPQAVTDARMVAHQLDIPYYVVDEIETFQRTVIDYFVAEYRRGRTPNPCVVCNSEVKFGSLLKKARALGADCVATGHYARIERAGTDGVAGPCRLRKGLDPAKDQSYFLFSLRPDQLAWTRLPLGELSKEQTRAIARKLNLKTHDKAESQEICFVPDQDYGRFLREHVQVPDRAGEIVTRDGTVVGHHHGIHYFTVGQREGLKLGGLKQPLYVVALDAPANRVIVGTADSLLRDEFDVADCNWLTTPEPGDPIEVTVKIRYNHPGCRAALSVVDAGGRGDRCRVRVRTQSPQRAVTPGQAAVFYREDLVLGGGWIC